MSLITALRFYKTVTKKNEIVIKKIQASLSEGKSFANSIHRYLNDELYYQLKFAEEHGDLITALKLICRFLKLKQLQKNKIVNLLVYPLILLSLLIVVMITIHSFILPEIQTAMPHTRFPNFRWLELVLFGGSLIGLSGFAVYFKRLNALERLALILKIPYFSKLCRYYYAYYFASNLSIMIKCGLTIQQITHLMCKLRQQQVLSTLGHEIRRLINQGQTGKQLLSKYKFIPLQMVVLMQSGDSTKVLAHNLQIYSEMNFKKMMKGSYRLINLIQPLMFIMIAAMIVWAYLSMLLPMYNSIKDVY